MNIRTAKTTRALIGSVAAVIAFSTAVMPGFAAAPTDALLTGPDAVGENTYVGRIDSPRAGQSVAEGANLQVTGWAVDKTARGWSGFDKVEVWSGAKGDPHAVKLADGMVGLSSPAVATSMGGDFARSEFSAVIPSANLADLQPGTQNLDVYLRTPNKGWWHQAVSVNMPTSVAADEPINVILRPLDGSLISQKQKFDKYTLFGYALDQTDITDPGNQGLGSCECGISSVAIYMDAIDRAHLMGNAAQNALVAFANKGKPTSMSVANFSPVSRQYGRQYDKAGWAFSFNPRVVSADWHTFYAVARSSITGKVSTAEVTMLIHEVPDSAKIVAP